MTHDLTNFNLSTYALESFRNEVLQSTDDDDYSLTVTLFTDPAINQFRNEWLDMGRPDNGDYDYWACYNDGYTLAMECNLRKVNGRSLVDLEVSSKGYGCCLVDDVTQEGSCAVVQEDSETGQKFLQTHIFHEDQFTQILRNGFESDYVDTGRTGFDSYALITDDSRFFTET